MLSEGSVAARVSRASLFPYARWQAARLADEYARGQPFPHVTLSNFLDDGIAARLSAEFPSIDEGPWIRYSHYNERKAGLVDRTHLSDFTRSVIDELNSDAFVEWLSALTGIPGLLADPSLEGGGMHQCGAGGFLNVHADFASHHHRKGWRRRVNLIVYLNERWQAEWGGAIEFWDRQMQRCVVRVPPLLNHAVIFSTDEYSYHGFPDPVACPPGVLRRSLALYYYTAEGEGTSRHPVAQTTTYRPRPGDGMRKAALIWTDTQLVRVYSRLKTFLGLSDDLASRSLGWLERRKRERT